MKLIKKLIEKLKAKKWKTVTSVTHTITADCECVEIYENGKTSVIAV